MANAHGRLSREYVSIKYQIKDEASLTSRTNLGGVTVAGDDAVRIVGSVDSEALRIVRVLAVVQLLLLRCSWGNPTPLLGTLSIMLVCSHLELRAHSR